MTGTVHATAHDYMVSNLVTVHPDTDAHYAIGLLLRHKISGMPVVDDDGTLVGILSERDCLKTLVNANYHNLPTALVRDLMSTDLTTIHADTDILQVAKMFVEGRYRRLPVVEAGRLVGQISRRDVLRAVQMPE
jgi:CBS domain-containing protein